MIPQARESLKNRLAYRWKQRSQSYSNQRRPTEIRSVEEEARYLAVKSLRGDPVSQLLARQPLPLVKDVFREVFENLANETVNESRGRIFEAAKGLKNARERSLPIVIVLYRSIGMDDHLDHPTQVVLNQMRNTPRISSMLKKYVIVTIPLDEVAALTNLATLPVYRFRSKTSPVLVFARSLGQQFDVHAGPIRADDLANRMERLMAETRFDRVNQLMKTGEFFTAELMLRKTMTKSSNDKSIRARARAQLSKVNLEWADRLAQNGKRSDAIRRFKRVKLMAKDERSRKLAESRIQYWSKKL